MKDLLKGDFSYRLENSYESQFLFRFMSEYPNTDFVQLKSVLALKTPQVAVALVIKALLSDDARIITSDVDDVIITGWYKGSPVMVWVDLQANTEIKEYTIKLTADPTSCEELLTKINALFEQENYPAVKWWYNASHGIEERTIFLPPNDQQILPEFYPDFDPIKLMEEYMASDEAVLILSGAPGTGKTTFLRYMISKFKLKTHIIYDESLMRSDTPFQNFMFDDGGRRSPSRPGKLNGGGATAMIIEDADTILTSRQDDGNKLMSRFLNVSDGLIKLPNRKLIFTTNIINVEKLDEAIVRPGRCYGIIHTRPLNLTEAQAAATAAGLTPPTEKGEYTLAELFNKSKRKVRRFGFLG